MNVCVASCVPVPSGHEEHLIPYSVVQPVQVQTKRPVIFSPSLLSHGLIERLLQPAESGLKFNTCQHGMCTASTLHHTHDAPNASEQTSASSLDYHVIHHSLLGFLWFAEPILASERRDKRVFLLDSCSPEQALGIRLQSIQDVISQVMKGTYFCCLFFFPRRIISSLCLQLINT